RMNGIGAHEVVIESPRHVETLATMGESAVEQVLGAFRDRVQDLKRDRRFRYIVIFKNYGKAAGASLDHSYSQLIALPIVPREVRDEMDGARAHYTAKELCVFCDIISQDSQDGRRLIAENADMVAMSPYAPRFPFETWILPKRHQALFEDTPRHEYASLARLLGDILRRMNKTLRHPPYNLLIHTAPLAEPAGDFYHWHVEIIPKLTKVAGFEWATGFYVNPTAPEKPPKSCATRAARRVEASVAAQHGLGIELRGAPRGQVCGNGRDEREQRRHRQERRRIERRQLEQQVLDVFRQHRCRTDAEHQPQQRQDRALAHHQA